MAMYISENSRNGVPQLGQDTGFDWGGLISQGLDIVKGVVTREVAPALPKVALPTYAAPVQTAPAVPVTRPAAGIGTGFAIGLPVIALGALALYFVFARGRR